MKNKHFWTKLLEGVDPFQLPRRLSRRLSECVENQDAVEGRPTIRYLWIFVTEEGLDRNRDLNGPGLDVERWLNVIDESASLGAEWLVIFAGASLNGCPEIWRLCQWAQEIHDMRVGLHVAAADLSDTEIDSLSALKPGRTCLMADDHVIESLRHLEQKGVCLCGANVRSEQRMSPCPNPQDITCVGIDGTLFTCGLVLGDEQFRLGNVLEQRLDDVMSDAGLPHIVPETVAYSAHGCDGCPPHMAQRVIAQLPE